MPEIVFDRRGAWMAVAFFGGLLALLTVWLAANLRHERLGRWGLSRRVRLVGFGSLAAVYLATLHGWLFWGTFYELRPLDRSAGLRLTVLAPEREIVIPLAELARVRQVVGSRAGFARLVIETRDAGRFRSPDRSPDEIRAALAAVESWIGARSSALVVPSLIARLPLEQLR